MTWCDRDTLSAMYGIQQTYHTVTVDRMTMVFVCSAVPSYFSFVVVVSQWWFEVSSVRPSVLSGATAAAAAVTLYTNQPSTLFAYNYSMVMIIACIVLTLLLLLMLLLCAVPLVAAWSLADRLWCGCREVRFNALQLDMTSSLAHTIIIATLLLIPVITSHQQHLAWHRHTHTQQTLW